MSEPIYTEIIAFARVQKMMGIPDGEVVKRLHANFGHVKGFSNRFAQRIVRGVQR